MKLALATAFAVMSLAGSAFAETSVTATLDTPQATPAQFIAAGAVWNCSGATCATGVAPDDSGGLSGCKALAKKIGKISAYSSDAKALDSKSLDKCNAVAAAPAPIGTASRYFDSSAGRRPSGRRLELLALAVSSQ